MTWQQAESQRRQFSRRETNRQAMAAIPGYPMLPCEIRNVSEGGALIAFDNGFVPDKPFRLLIDGAGLNIRCEVRHATKQGIGVRFFSIPDGVQLIQYLYQEPVQAPSAFTVEVQTSVAISNRDLRDGLLAARTAASVDTTA
jgi:hypothetical protein